MDKGDFTGRAATLEQKEQKFRLVYFEVEASDSDVGGGEPIFKGAECVGVTTSGGYGHATGKSLGFGYVSPDLAGEGTQLRVSLLGERCQAVVLAEAVYDPTNERLRA